MKTHKTMYRLARDLAYKKGMMILTIEDQRHIGYYITQAELRGLYVQEGFLASTADRHLAVWEALGLISIVKLHSGKSILFVLPDRRDPEDAVLRRYSEFEPSLSDDILHVREAAA